MQRVLILLLSGLIISLSARGQSAADFSSRSTLDPGLAPFFHGVASGDPLPNKVIIWTRVTTDSSGPVDVQWRMAADVGMSSVVNSGTFTTSAARDYTVKVDVTGLSPNTSYYYEFETDGRRSQIGRTKTAPIGDVDSLRFAVVSCSNYQAGYFNAYARLGDRNDIDAIIHLGDYIYEYETGGYGFDPAVNREHQPDHEAISLSDYRIRHSWYKLDADLRHLHQMHPIIAVYDDHEFANDAWKSGAENHDPAVEGPWSLRRSAGYQAWLEWVPMRQPDLLDPERIYRNMYYGDLLDLFMVDTRIIGRDSQVSASSGSAGDPNRSLLGPVQRDWLFNAMRNSNARWKVMANQVMLAPLEILGAPVNMDQWDGYTADRDRLYNVIRDDSVSNFVVLTGDIHSAWSNDLQSSTGNRGVEFVCTSITSPGFPITGGEFFVYLFNAHVQYVNLLERGYLLMDFNKTRAQGDHYFMNTITSPSVAEYVGSSWHVNEGSTSLQASAAPSSRPGIGPDRPPPYPSNPCTVPLNPFTNGIGPGTATVNWDPVADALGYKLQGREFAGPTRNLLIGGASKTFNFFQPATTYEWRVATGCADSSLTAYTAWQVFTTPSAREGDAASGTSDSGSGVSDALLSPQGETRSLAAPVLVNLLPNPFVTGFGMKFSLQNEAKVAVALLDMQGRTSFREELGSLPAGVHFREFMPRDLATGAYLLVLEAGGERVYRLVERQ